MNECRSCKTSIPCWVDYCVPCAQTLLQRWDQNSPREILEQLEDFMLGPYKFTYTPIHYHNGPSRLILHGPQGDKVVEASQASRMHTSIMSKPEGEERLVFIKSIYESITNDS